MTHGKSAQCLAYGKLYISNKHYYYERAGYIICRALCKMKTWGPCSKRIKNFKMMTSLGPCATARVTYP